MDYGHMQESILKMSSPSSKKYAKVHEKAPKLKIQEPKKSQIPGSQEPNKNQISNPNIQLKTNTQIQNIKAEYI
jgi:hypothetical protein